MADDEDPFEGFKGSDPWSDKTWGQNAMNTSFEAETDIFEFSAAPSVAGTELFESSVPFPTELDHSFEQPDAPKVQVMLHEQLSVVYDDAGEPTSQIQGKVIVKPKREMTKPFCLTVYDPGNHIQRLDAAQNTQIVKRQQQPQRMDTVLRVMQQTAGEAIVANYTCVPSLRPVPILVKTRVHMEHHFNRVGFKIRANPSNLHNLTRIVLIMAVPPHVDGESVKMSRQGGIWDEMKRTLSWFIDKLAPGAAIEIQAQFATIDGKEKRAKFPILVRTEYPVIYSAVQVKTDFMDSVCTPIRMSLSESSRLLHRKI